MERDEQGESIRRLQCILDYPLFPIYHQQEDLVSSAMERVFTNYFNPHKRINRCSGRAKPLRYASDLSSSVDQTQQDIRVDQTHIIVCQTCSREGQAGHV